MRTSSSAGVHLLVTAPTVLGLFSWVQRYLRSLPQRPGKSSAINAQRFPETACNCMRTSSSAAVQLQTALSSAGVAVAENTVLDKALQKVNLNFKLALDSKSKSILRYRNEDSN